MGRALRQAQGGVVGGEDLLCPDLSGGPCSAAAGKRFERDTARAEAAALRKTRGPTFHR